MRFINKGEARKVRIEEKDYTYRWEVVKEGQTIDLPSNYGYNLGFEPYEEEPQEEVKEEEPVEEPEVQPEEVEVYKEELMQIDGIGPKTAEDLVSQFPKKEELINALEAGEDFYRDNVMNKLRETYL